jgi:hypothetical protein
MVPRRLVVDGRNLYSPKTMQELGFEYYSFGRPTVDAFVGKAGEIDPHIDEIWRAEMTAAQGLSESFRLPMGRKPNT